MSVTIITIHFPFRHLNNNILELRVTRDTLVSDIIHSSVDYLGAKFVGNPELYGIYLKPNNFFLFPQLHVYDYFSYLIPNDSNPVLEFRYKNPRALKVTFLNYQTVIYCDPMEHISSIIQETVKRLRGRHNATANWMDDEKVIFLGDKKLNESEPVKTFFEDLDDVPVLTLRREILPLHGGSVFKGNVVDALEREGYANKVPFFFTKLLELIEQKKETVGIYRKSGEHDVIDSIVSKLETMSDKTEISNYLEGQNVHELACVVKQYLRSINEPIFPSYFISDLQNIVKQNKIETIKLIKNLVNSLPTAHINLLQSLSEHLNKIVEATKLNQMTLKSLAICIAPNFIRVNSQGEQLIKMTEIIQTISQLIFENWRFVFLDEPCILEDNQGKLLEDYIKGDVTIKKDTNVTITNRDNDNYTFDYNRKSYTIKKEMISVRPPHLINSFDSWININCESIPVLQYLMPSDPHNIKTKGIDTAIESKLKRIKKIRNNLIKITENEINESDMNNEISTLFQEFSKL